MGFDFPDGSPELGLAEGESRATWGELCAAAEEKRAAHRAGMPSPFEATPTRAAIVELLAIWRAGAIAVPLHPGWGTAERGEVLADAGLGRPLAGREGDGGGEELAALVRTSGSSGRPKLAALSHRALGAAARASALRLGWVEGDRWLLALPFAHVGGLSVIVRCLLARKAIVLGQGPHTLASLVPTQLARLVRQGVRAPPGLRALLLGGAMASPALVADARALGWPIRLTYGLTETCAQFATQQPGDPDDTCGAPLDGYEARLDEGRLSLRSPSLLSGFVERGQLVSALDAEGWLRTSDCAELREGRLRILGRADEVINSGGEKIHPAAVEALLGPEVCVVGLPDAEWGQQVVALVAARELAQVQERLERLRGVLSRHAWPKRLIAVAQLPVNANGKVSRAQAARLAAEPHQGV